MAEGPVCRRALRLSRGCSLRRERSCEVVLPVGWEDGGELRSRPS